MKKTIIGNLCVSRSKSSFHNFIVKVTPVIDETKIIEELEFMNEEESQCEFLLIVRLLAAAEKYRNI